MSTPQSSPMSSSLVNPSAAQSIWLVAQREISTRAKTRSFLISTGLLMVVIIVGAIIIAAFTGKDSADRVGIVGNDATLSATITQVGATSGTSIDVVSIGTEAQARSQVADGGLDAAIVGAPGTNRYVVISEKALSDKLQGPIRTAIAQQSLAQSLSARGVDIASLPSPSISWQQTTPDNPDEGQRIVIALVGSVLLITAIITGGSMVAVGVVEEKTSRIVELLLAAIKPLHLLWGKIIGIGVIALGQVLVLGATALIAGKLTGLLTLPGLAVGMFAAVVAWFILGFLFFAILYAATGALVSRQEELNASSAPLTILAMAVMYAAVFGVQALDSTFIQVLSWIPPFSATLMPMRIATGDTNAVQIVVTFALMAVVCAIATWLAARIYERSILRTGSRVKWSEALQMARS